MSRNEALEAENASLKAERSKLKKQVARERYQLSEEKKLHEQVHSSLVEGRVAAAEIAAAEARQLSETINTTNDALEEARKSLKELEDRLASTHTVPGRSINFDNPSRWTIGKDVDNLAQFSLPALATTGRRAAQPRRRVQSRPSTRVKQRILRTSSVRF
jgi:predicted RNase H-like nuclease (RuvC/YqgF family)